MLKFKLGCYTLHMFPAEVNKILDYIAEYTSLSAESDSLQEECELTHEDLLAAEPNPSSHILKFSCRTLTRTRNIRGRRNSTPEVPFPI